MNKKYDEQYIKDHWWAVEGDTDWDHISDTEKLTISVMLKYSKWLRWWNVFMFRTDLTPEEISQLKYGVEEFRKHYTFVKPACSPDLQYKIETRLAYLESFC